MFAEDVDDVLAALSQPLRRQIVELLAEGPHRAGELAEGAEVAASIMSKALRTLLEAEIIDDERSPADARVRLFFLRRDSLAPLQDWLERVQQR